MQWYIYTYIHIHIDIYIYIYISISISICTYIHLCAKLARLWLAERVVADVDVGLEALKGDS